MIEGQIIFGFVILGLACLSLFYEMNKSIAFKKKLLPWMIFLFYPFLIFFCLVGTGFPLAMLLKIVPILLPLIYLFSYLEWKNSVFCNNCGKRSIGYFSKKEVCSKCGAKLEAKT